jgi:hypothetical protein
MGGGWWVGLKETGHATYSREIDTFGPRTAVRMQTLRHQQTRGTAYLLDQVVQILRQGGAQAVALQDTQNLAARHGLDLEDGGHRTEHQPTKTRAARKANNNRATTTMHTTKSAKEEGEGGWGAGVQGVRVRTSPKRRPRPEPTPACRRRRRRRRKGQRSGEGGATPHSTSHNDGLGGWVSHHATPPTHAQPVLPWNTRHPQPSPATVQGPLPTAAPPVLVLTPTTCTMHHAPCTMHPVHARVQVAGGSGCASHSPSSPPPPLLHAPGHSVQAAQPPHLCNPQRVSQVDTDLRRGQALLGQAAHVLLHITGGDLQPRGGRALVGERGVRNPLTATGRGGGSRHAT